MEGVDDGYGSGQIDFSPFREIIIVTNRNSRRGGNAELGPNRRQIASMLNANYKSLIDNGCRFH